MSGLPTSITDITTDPSTWRLQTASGVRYKKLEHTGSLTFNSISCKEVYVIEDADLLTFIRDFFPLPELSSPVLPVTTYGVMQGKINITASNMEWQAHIEGLPIDPFQADVDAPYATYCRLLRVTVTFDDEVAKPENNGDPADPTTFLEISANASGDFFHTPIPSAIWETSDTDSTGVNTAPNVPAQINVPEIDWTLTWPRVNELHFRNVLLPRMRAAMGKVNQNTFSLCYNAAPETLLFVGWDMSQERQFLFDEERSIAAYLQLPIRVSLKFLEKRVEIEDGSSEGTLAGHNHLWRPGLGWRRLLIDGTDPIYASYNFDDLFTV